jgi:hypothetical protein
MSPPSGKSESGLARLIGSGTSGLLELFIFHPIDTTAKRLMTNPNKVRSLSRYLVLLKKKSLNLVFFLGFYAGSTSVPRLQEP